MHRSEPFESPMVYQEFFLNIDQWQERAWETASTCTTEVVVPIKDGDLGERRGCDSQQRICEETHSNIWWAALQCNLNVARCDLEGPKRLAP